MTSKEFWQAVGEFFLVARQRKTLKPSHVQGLGGPHYDTVADIERGRVGNIERLESYATALGLDLVDVFRTVLKSEPQALSPEAHQLIRKYETTTLAGRQALVALAAALPAADTPSARGKSLDAVGAHTVDTPIEPIEAHGRKRKRGGRRRP